ncbi:MAG: YbhB/YbcL family Raf kinase inhibitor-like protein [Candidatus Wallbacteria bacterium]|nr:YbhB/YbcL family Raf kinase inhibitor-like protein [Candidatus Wallbacteria bacterium]
MQKLTLKSPVFEESKAIPSKYTSDGENISPPLTWSEVPKGAKSLALISDDPDSPMGTWVHWVVYNIPPTATGLPEKILQTEKLPDGTLQGLSDFKKTGYCGPCPPAGTHHYFFKLYALDILLPDKPGLTKSGLESLMNGHILAQGELVGLYKRKK